MKRAATAAIAVLGVVSLAVGRQQLPATQTTTAPARTATPNIILVMIDALRADGLEVYGNPRSLSPTIDAVAAKGVVFDSCIAPAPWTLPSVVSIFCSRYPEAHGITDHRKAKASPWGRTKASAPPVRFLPTLAESLKARGYATAAFVANAYIRRGVYLTQGFDVYDSSFAANTTPGSTLNDAAIDWLRQRDPARPFFIYLHYMDVHGPYDAGPEFLDDLLDAVEQSPQKHRLSPASLSALPNYLRPLSDRATDPERHERLEIYREYWVARYEAGIREFDHYLADLRGRLREMRLWGDAYIIITADHGEALGEHGLWHHGLSAHHTDLHVPFILRWPGALPAGRRVPGPVSLIDLMPTIIEQLGLPSPPGLQGVSLCASIRALTPPPPRPVFAEAVKFKPQQRAVYFGDWKLMSLRGSLHRLYHLADDPAERQDLVDKQPERFRLLQDILRRQIEQDARLAGDTDIQPVPLTPEDVERLKSLGYIEPRPVPFD
ncbi:MAG: sulfatase [Phycisphaerales bacterium]|nr:MAG: sulfatase [Phycisphaerales bacterium]